MKRIFRRRAIAIGVVVILGLLAALPFKMLRTDDLQGKYNPSPSNALAQQVMAAAVLGQKTSFSDSTVNEFLAYHWQTISSYLGELAPKQLYVQFKDKDTVAAYTPVMWRGKHLGITSESTVLYHPDKKELSITVQQIKLGRLSVPANWVLDRAFSKELPAGVTREDNVIRIDASSWLESPEAVQYGVSLLSLQVTKGKLSLHATADKGQVGEQVKNELQDWFQQNWAGDWNDALGQLQDYLKSSGILQK